MSYKSRLEKTETYKVFSLLIKLSLEQIIDLNLFPERACVCEPVSNCTGHGEISRSMSERGKRKGGNVCVREKNTRERKG